MFSHVLLGCSDRARARDFYNATFGALGVRPHHDMGQSDWWVTRDAAFGIGQPLDGNPCSHGNGSTIGFRASSPAEVNAWHDAGVATGGTSIEDPPGIRETPFGKLYLAYLRDPDGNKLCGYFRYPGD